MASTVVNIPWDRHPPATVNVGSKARIEGDPYDLPLPVEGVIVGVRVVKRKLIDIGQEPFYVIVLLEETGSDRNREFDLEEVTITYI